LGQVIGQIAIIAKQQQTFTVVIKPAEGINPLAHIFDQVHHRGAAFRVGNRGYVTFGFVQQQVDVALRALKKFAVDLHVIA